MSNALCVAWRTPCSGLVPSSLLPSKPTLFRSILCDLRISPSCHSYSSVRRYLYTFDRASLRIPPPAILRSNQTVPATINRSFTTSVSLLSQSTPPVEHGAPPRPQAFTTAEIKGIFGPRVKISTEMGNRVLAVLHGRRVSGTLDLDLPKDIIRAVSASSRDVALEWLREAFPLDEDAAILRRIEREELEEQQKLIRRAEELGLYKPQSGTFGAELGEQNDPYGKSVLKEIREENEARLLAEQERKRQEWLEGEQEDRERLKRHIEKNTSLQKFEDASALEVRERADPTERPVLAWVQKHHLQATEWDMDVSKMTTARRILPSLAVTLLVLGLSYFYAVNYEPPAKGDRMWPDIPPAAATVLAIIGGNLAIYLLWCLPPAWRLLNRYFINVAARPQPISIVGSVFSHQQVQHLGVNMLMLWFIGTRLHDDIGRGQFLGLYMAAGAFGSMASLTVHVLLGNLMTTSLGASGAISGIVAAWCLLHSEEKFTIFFLPHEWHEVISVKGWILLAGLIAFETFNLVSRYRVARLDHWAHLGGYLVGGVWATAWKREHDRKRRENRPWLQRVLSE
ncbi:rhomboid protease PCP1 [Aspergillus clavatus NRRL 1]|uniref:Rhomboid family protein, putative n=1 Tax=Aspergillus clavatus (strain ATCC 1007 / CBS 513.65 / DSM 816 / NCTC 3887 / NRRL 1 / QM 1276 / 107) TaxID=344612 RepID=A1CQJ4_ASPCL|nr:rhomboid family protein, putative [Aspergillus clavatus NRRL 1]EAW07915.1 rhomboid family protein, putative [Aspergillus clavatus NRRL 1]